MTTYVLVHGGGVGGWIWADAAARLEKAGHRVEVIEQLTSTGSDSSTLGDLAADAELVRRRVDAVGGPVVLVGHSYGGMVVTELADHPSVAHTVYLAAVWPRRGQSAMDVLADGPPIDWATAGEDGTLRFTEDLEVLRRAYCGDVEMAQAEATLRRMVAASMSLSALGAPSTAPDRAHATTYVICEQDRILPPAIQEQMAAAADHVERIPASHQPLMSMPEEVAGVLGLAG